MPSIGGGLPRAGASQGGSGSLGSASWRRKARDRRRLPQSGAEGWGGGEQRRGHLQGAQRGRVQRLGDWLVFALGFIFPAAQPEPGIPGIPGLLKTPMGSGTNLLFDEVSVGPGQQEAALAYPVQAGSIFPGNRQRGRSRLEPGFLI